MKKAVVIGSLNLDYSLAVAHLPLPGETILAQGLTMNPGGKGANQGPTRSESWAVRPA